MHFLTKRVEKWGRQFIKYPRFPEGNLVLISYTTTTNTDDLTMKRDLRNDAMCVRGLSLAHTLLLKVNFGLAGRLNKR